MPVLWRPRHGARYLLARLLEARVYRQADGVVAIAEGLRRDLIHRWVPDHIASLAAERDESVAILPPVPHGSVGESCAAADVLAYPRLSTRATQLVTPLTPLEAMAMGKAIVASDVGGLKELLTDGETAVLVPPGSPELLADALGDLLDDEPRRRRLGEAAGKIACQRLDWRMVARRYLGVYKAVRER